MGMRAWVCAWWLAWLSGPALAIGPPTGPTDDAYGPQAVIDFSRRYRGGLCRPGALVQYPAAQGIPWADTRNIIPMTAELWTPAQLSADFQRRTAGLAGPERKVGILVLLKTERCAVKAVRYCSTTTAALEKRSTPLVGQFVIYGVQLLPRDQDDPPGSRAVETGTDAWKNAAAGEYRFRQGPGATLVFLRPSDGARLDSSDAYRLGLDEPQLLRDHGRTPQLEDELMRVLRMLGEYPATR